MSGAEQLNQTEWLMLNFTIPKEPSRIRVSTWRKLKKSGSVNIGQSMWVLPLSEEHLGFFQDLSQYILQNNGEAYILKADFIDTGNVNDISSIFNQARDEEYKEFLDKCKDFIRELEKETQKENFTFAEVEENEDEYEKLAAWLKKISKRDFFDSSLALSSTTALKQCEEAYSVFSEKVYEKNS